MTVDEFLAVVEWCSVRNPPFPITITTDVRPVSWAPRLEEVSVKIVTRIPCRDTGQIIDFVHHKSYGSRSIDQFDEDWAIRVLQEQMRSVFDHEFRECWCVDGERVLDSHVGERA